MSHVEPPANPRVVARLHRDESGQVMIVTGLLLVIMLVVVALVVDIGHTMLVQRQLQAGVDAAALAGARNLADPPTATATAHEFSPTPAKKNAVNTVDNATTTVNVRCITTIPGCNTRYSTVNAISVTSSSSVPTFFGKIIGVNQLTVSAKATACFPCVVKPLDIMVILDRTGSMCDKPGDNPDSPGNNDCRDLDAARAGVATFISLMDPALVRIGLAVSPPAIGAAPPGGLSCPDCRPTQGNLYFGYDAWSPHWLTDFAANGYRNQDRAYYVIQSLTDDDVDGDPSDNYVRKVSGQWELNPNAPLVQRLAGIRAGGSTSYAMAIAEASRELVEHGRPDVPNVIIFFTDGGANTSQDMANGFWLNSSTWFNRPCGAGVEAATNQLAPDTVFLSIGYDLVNQHLPGQRCQPPNPGNGHQDNGTGVEATQSWGNTPKQALQAMASEPEYYFEPTTPAELVPLFDELARVVQNVPARLVHNELPDLVE